MEFFNISANLAVVIFSVNVSGKGFGSFYSPKFKDT
jgi:hypothetical protein